MANNQNYREQVAAMQQINQLRQERAQREHYSQLQEIRENYADAVQGRNEAAQRGDRGDWDAYDEWAVDLEQRWNQLNPPPAHDPRLVNFVNRNSNFFQRYGANAMAAAGAAHEYLMRPRNPNTNDPRYTGCGMRPEAVYSPVYFAKMKALLELHGKDFAGVKYDPGEQALTPDEAAKISGLTPNQYNHAVRTMHAQDRLGIYKK